MFIHGAGNRPESSKNHRLARIDRLFFSQKLHCLVVSSGTERLAPFAHGKVAALVDVELEMEPFVAEGDRKPPAVAIGPEAAAVQKDGEVVSGGENAQEARPCRIKETGNYILE